MNSVGKGVIKKDAMALVTGQPVYCDDLAPKDCLIVKLLRSPHAYAKIRSIDTSIAKRIPGIEAVYTYEDVPTSRFTLAGQSYPEPSPYDRRILENVVRYVGDEVAIVAGANEDCVDRALKAIKVDYEVLEPLLDFEKSIDNKIVVHEEDDYKCLCEIGNDVKRNIVSSGESVVGDVDAVLKECDVVLERDYHTKANAQAMMETGFLRFGGDVKKEQYNFAGLGATGGGNPGNSFSSIRIGIRAQIQHLKAYACDEELNQDCVDTRFDMVKRCAAPYVEWLGQKENPDGVGWAEGANYGEKLRKLLAELKEE